jgi:hypothetical protein
MNFRTIAAPTSLAALALLLSGCGASADEQAAEAVYDACVIEDALAQLLQLDGNAVSVVVEGEHARALAGFEDEIDALTSSAPSSDDGEVSGTAVAAALLLNVDCLAEETGYPGSSDQIQSGEEWEGWRVEENSGAGSESTITFTAVGH